MLADMDFVVFDRKLSGGAQGKSCQNVEIRFQLDIKPGHILP